jgi:hypothetical protein
MTPTKNAQALSITKGNKKVINDKQKQLLETMEQWLDSLPVATLLTFRAKLTGEPA